jgi:hypothetical protein
LRLSKISRAPVLSSRLAALGAGIGQMTSSTSHYADFRISTTNSSTLPRSAGGVHFTGLRNRAGI